MRFRMPELMLTAHFGRLHALQSLLGDDMQSYVDNGHALP